MQLLDQQLVACKREWQVSVAASQDAERVESSAWKAKLSAMETKMEVTTIINRQQISLNFHLSCAQLANL